MHWEPKWAERGSGERTGTFGFGPWGGAKALRLTEHQPGLFFSSTGEALDLGKSPPTYANIPLYEDEGLTEGAGVPRMQRASPSC